MHTHYCGMYICTHSNSDLDLMSMVNELIAQVHGEYMLCMLGACRVLKIPFKPLPSPLEKHSNPEYVEGYDTHPKEGNPS